MTETATQTKAGKRTKPPFRADHVGSLLRPPRLLRARDEFAAARSTRPSCVGSRTRRSARSCASRRRPGCSRRPTASFAAPRGTWTSSTSSTASRKEAGHIAVTFHNADGDIEFTPAALHVDGKLGVSKTIFGDDFAFLQRDGRRRTSRS